MPLSIIDQYQVKYENIWRRLVQQADSRLLKAVEYKSGCEGEVLFIDQIRPIDVTPLTLRLQATPIIEIETEKRALYPEKFAVPRHFDEFDDKLLAAQSLPTSQTFMEMKSGVNRKIDDLIIAAATGIARTGVNGATNTALPATQQIAVDRGTGTNENFTIDKWLDLKERFEAAEVVGQDAMESMYYIVLSSSQLRGLYNESRITSSDFAADLKALYYGEIDQFLGGQVIRSERLALTGTVRSCFAFVKSGICFGMWTDPSFRLVERHDFNDALQLRGKFQAGATRLEEEKVIEILCDEAA